MQRKEAFTLIELLVVIGWTKHTNNYSGTITWDVPLDNSGLIPEKHFKQLSALRKYVVA